MTEDSLKKDKSVTVRHRAARIVDLPFETKCARLKAGRGR